MRAATPDTGAMPVEETMWDVMVPKDVDARQPDIRLLLADLIAKRLPADKKLLRVVGWSADGGCLYRSCGAMRRYAVAYHVQFAF